MVNADFLRGIFKVRNSDCYPLRKEKWNKDWMGKRESMDCRIERKGQLAIINCTILHTLGGVCPAGDSLSTFVSFVSAFLVLLDNEHAS